MDLIERLKKKKIINEDNTFNTNKNEYNHETVNTPNIEITKHKKTPMRIIKPDTVWNQVQDIINKNQTSTQRLTNSNIYSNKDNVTLENKYNANMTKPQETPNNKIYERETKKINLPVAKLATNEETKDANTISIQEVQATKEADKINKQIEKGGYEKANALISNTLKGFQGGVQQGVGGIANAGLTLTAGAIQKIKDDAKKIGLLNEDLEKILDNAYDKVLDSSDYVSNTANENNYINSNIKDDTVKTAGNVSSVIGNMLPSIGANMIAPGSGLVATGVSAGGRTAQENINNDRSNIYQSIGTGVLKGGVEALTEKITGGNILSKGSLDDIVGKAISENVKTNIGKAISNKTYQFMGEMLEEQISDNAGYIIDKVINGKSLPSFEEWWKNAGETNKTTFLSTLVLNMLGLGGGTLPNKNETKHLNDVKKIVNNDSEIQKNIQVLKQQIQNAEEVKNNQPEQGIHQNILSMQQDTQQNNKMSQNQISKEISIPLRNYQYQATDNAKINNLRMDMSKYWTDSNETKALGSVIEKIIEDKGYNVRLDNTINNNGNSANAKITTLDNGELEIRINPNSKNVGEFLLMHETTHAIGTQEMKELVMDYASKNNEFNQALESLKKTYNTNDVSDEVLADISGKLFGNQEFINNLSMEKPTVFKRIYNKIIEWANKITGNSHEALFIKDLKNKWEQAYRTQNNNLNEKTQYHISESFSSEIDKSLNNKLPSNTQVKARDYTPKILVENGVEDLPMLITQKHIRSTIYTLQEAQNLGLQTKNINYHGLGKDLLIKAIDNLDNPRAIYKTGENNYLIVTEFKDSNNREIIVPIQINGKGLYNDVYIDENQIKSVYGRNNLSQYIKRNNFKNIYNKKETSTLNEGIQYSNISNNVSNNIILPTQQNVNSSTDTYSMQDSENNSGKFKLPTKEWTKHLEDNYKSKGTRTNLEDIRLPTKEIKNSNKSYINLPIDNYNLRDEDYEVINKIYEREGTTEILPTRSTRQTKVLDRLYRDKTNVKDSIDTIAQKLVNKGHYIDKLADKTNNSELKFAYDKLLNSQAEGQYVVGVAQTDNKGNRIGKSINDIWKSVEESKLVKEFSEYLLHKHNIDRSGRKKFVFGEEIGPTESTKIALDLSKQYPQFKQWEKDIKQFNDNNLNNLKEAGLLTQDTIDYIKAMYPNYVSIARAIEGNLYSKTDKTGVGAPLKRAIGGSTDIQPLKDAMAEQVLRVKRLVNENQVGIELSKSLKNAIIDEESSIEYTPELLMATDTLVSEDSLDGNKYYIYFENGKQKKLKIDDKLYESLRKSEQYKIENTLPMRAIQKISNVYRGLLTSDNPVFIATNFLKDFQDGIFNSKYSSKFIKNYGKALNEIFTKGKYYESYMANGGMTNTYFDYNKGTNQRKNKFVEKIRNMNEIVEQTPRLAEFISTLEDGKSLNEALYNAAEITTNFKRGGDIAKALNRNGANFLNASIQGFDKQYRNITQQKGGKAYVNLLIKATALGVVPSVLNHLLLDDDEDYKDLPQSTKDLYYLFKNGDGKFIRIPKGRVLSIFGSIARRTIETSQKQDDAWEGFGDTIKNQIAPNNPFESNIASPIVAVASNKTWYGTDLVSSRLQKELPKNQYDETTDEFSKWLGSKLNISPKKINYLLDQYSGGIGDVLLPIITPQAKENVFIDKFTTDSVLKNKNVSKFYDTMEKQTQIANDPLATDIDQLQYKYLNSKLSDVNDLYKEKREIQMSNISKKEKKNKVRDIQQKINNTVEEALEKYSNYNIGNNSGNVGGVDYYKDGKGNWKELSEEEKEKIDNISIETYSDYKQESSNLKTKKIQSGELTKNQDLKNKDKIQILLDSNYSNKEKMAIYENYIKDAEDEKYDVIKRTGININQYLKYKQQEFESDKKDDGTLDGKTVTNSKKEKVYNYINSMNISYEQRLVLLGMQYKLNASERTKLAHYINELPNTKKEEKLNIYNKMKGFTVYKNGRVTW